METLKNITVLEFLKENGMSKCVSFLKQKCVANKMPTDKAFEYSIKKVRDTCEKLNRNKHRPTTLEELQCFKENDFVFPESCLRKRIAHISSSESVTLEDCYSEKKKEAQVLKEKSHELEAKVSGYESELKLKDSQLSFSAKKLKDVRLNLKRTTAREKYANEKIQKLEEKVEQYASKNEEIADIESRLDQTESEEIAFLKYTVNEKENEIGQLNESVQYLNDIIYDIDNETRTVPLFDEKLKKYTPELKSCVYDLLQFNVAASNVGNVIKSVLKLVNVEPNRVPSKSTVLEMNYQRLCLAHKHLTDVFSQKKDTCLLTDETSKFGTKFMGYEASDSEGNLWVLGLREIETKSSSDTLNVFKQIMADLDECKGDNSPSKDIISHISATMSDRAATELKFNDLLQQYRKEVLPLAIQNYDRFTQEEKTAVESLNNYFCGLHALVNYAETTQKSIGELENKIFDGKVPLYDKTFKTNEPGTCRLIRTAAKCMGDGSGGDEKSGCQGAFRTYIHNLLVEKGLKSVPLKSYKGSRFNILFSNASSVFFLHEHMKSFFECVGTNNNLQRSILFDLKVPEFIAGTKALSYISKFITCPLWSVLEDKTVSITDMNSKYLQVVTFLEDAIENIDQFMAGELCLFGQVHVERDYIVEHLLQPREYDNIVQSHLEVTLLAICGLARRLYKDHLPGGKVVGVDPKKVRSVPKTSSFAESVFGQLDQIMRTKPSISTLAAESCIMFLNNKTSEWLKSKKEHERKELIENASKNVKNVKAAYKNRLCEIKQNRRLKQQELMMKKQHLERERVERQTKYTENMIRHGLWQSTEEVENMLASYQSEIEKVEALKAQLKFRKEVLNQVAETKSQFNLTKGMKGSKKRKKLTVDELKENLINIVKQALVKDRENDEEIHILVGKRVRHRFEEVTDGKKMYKWYNGRIISQVPGFREWFNIIYDSDDSIYTYHRLDSDVETADLQIIV